MFGSEFSFSSFGQSSGSSEYLTLSQEDAAGSQSYGGGGGNGVGGRPSISAQRDSSRPLLHGIVPSTVALVANSVKAKTCDESHCELYGQAVETVALCGVIRAVVEDDNGVWTGYLDDGTGIIGFRYEVPLHRSAEYQGTLNRLRPWSEQPLSASIAPAVPASLNTPASSIPSDKPKEGGGVSLSQTGSQWPCMMHGTPRLIHSELHLLVAHLRPAEPLEYAASHALEIACIYLQHKSSLHGDVSNTSHTLHISHTSHTNSASSHDPTKGDPERASDNAQRRPEDQENQSPYHGKELTFEDNPEYADFVAEDKLRAKVLQLLLDRKAKSERIPKQTILSSFPSASRKCPMWDHAPLPIHCYLLPSSNGYSSYMIDSYHMRMTCHTSLTYCRKKGG